MGFMLLSSLFWAAMELAGAFVPHGHKAMQIVWVRYGTHLIFMLAAFGPRYRTGLARTRALKLQIFRPVFMIGMPLCFLISLRFMPFQNVWAIFWVMPLMIMVLAAVLLREKITAMQWLAIGVGSAGAIAMYQPQLEFLNWTIIFPLGMAFCFSAYLILTRVLHEENTVTSLFYTALVVFLPWSLGLFYFWQPLGLVALLVMAIIGILGFWSLYFMDKACEHAPVSTFTPILFTQPIFTVLLSYVLFQSVPSTMAILGTLLLVAITVAVMVHEYLQQKRSADRTQLEEIAVK
jgi:drug/metabolite transporter (DMT)-like permease